MKKYEVIRRTQLRNFREIRSDTPKRNKEDKKSRYRFRTGSCAYTGKLTLFTDDEFPACDGFNQEPGIRIVL